MPPRLRCALILPVLLHPLAAPAQDTLPQPTVLEVMERVITPASDILWGADDPQTGAEWDALENAALSITALAAFLDAGGSGSADRDWAADPAWKSFNGQMAQASVAARTAILDRDVDALFEAGDALYDQCEACHQQFNPAVTTQ